MMAVSMEVILIEMKNVDFRRLVNE